MRLEPKILGLPASVLLLIASHANVAQADGTPAQWPYNFPPHVKYWPEDPPNRRRDLEAIEEHLRLGRSPVGVMKMGADEGEKFYMEYWQFEGGLEESKAAGEVGSSALSSIPLRIRNDEETKRLPLNSSSSITYRPPFALHTEDKLDYLEYQDLGARIDISGRSAAAAAALAVLQKRGFICPSGTSDCSSIGYPNSCCFTGETCYAIENTGLGPVGCCPDGEICSGEVTSCESGYTACGESLGGGCCIPDYVCAGVGCVFNSATVVTVSTTVTFTGAPSISSTVTVTVQSTVATTTTTANTALQTTLTCTSSYKACAVDLGGGCCPSDYTCGSSLCISPSSLATKTVTTTTTTASGVAPIRPTNSVTATTSTTTATDTICPTGFYACEAYYAGGCCRTGRNCDSTSCPAISSTTIVSGAETIVVPVGTAATLTTPTGSCATGWFSCAVSEGGNCCPSGYQCGTASCTTVGASFTEVAAKEIPSRGMRMTELKSCFVVLATILAVIINCCVD